MIEHPSDIKIKIPGTLEMLPPHLKAGKVCAAYFDGGSANKLGTAGYVCYLPSGRVWFGGGELLPPH